MRSGAIRIVYERIENIKRARLGGRTKKFTAMF
jgi:hypothetical protein